MKPVTNARQREDERLRRLEEQRVREACAGLASRLTEAGWTNVKVEYRAFFQISGDDPQGVNRSGAYADGEAGVAEMLAAGEPPPPRKKPEPPPPAIDREADEFRHPEQHSYEEPEIVTFEAAPPPPAELSAPAPLDFVGGVLVRGPDDEPPLELDQVVGGPSPERAGGTQIEAAPDPLARLVPPNLDLQSQKAWASQRWLHLNALLLDEAKPEDQRVFNPMTTVEKAELELLQRWIGWFS